MTLRSCVTASRAGSVCVGVRRRACMRRAADIRRVARSPANAVCSFVVGVEHFVVRRSDTVKRMELTIRDAVSEDAPFLAWVMLAAARSHLPLSFWDYAFPGPDAPRLGYIAAMAVAEPICFTHYSGFLVAEHEGEPVGALSGYDSAYKSIEAFFSALTALLDAREWSADHQRLLMARMAPMGTCMPDSPPGVWVIEWVATTPNARGRGVANALLREILARGRAAGYTRSQIGYLLGNTPAQIAYERVGFETVEEKRHPEFEAAFGSAGIARMVRDL